MHSRQLLIVKKFQMPLGRDQALRPVEADDDHGAIVILLVQRRQDMHDLGEGLSDRKFVAVDLVAADFRLNGKSVDGLEFLGNRLGCRQDPGQR